MNLGRLFSRRKRGGHPRARVVPVWRIRAGADRLALILVAVLCGSGWLAWQAGVPQRAAASLAHSLVEASADSGSWCGTYSLSADQLTESDAASCARG